MLEDTTSLTPGGEEVLSLALPAYTVNRSDRARRVRLSVSARKGLVVTVPSHWRGDIEAIVRSKRAWAEKCLAAVAERRALLLAGPEALLPHVIEFPATAAKLPVEYQPTSSSVVRATTKQGSVFVSGNIDDPERCLLALRRWLAREAEQHLIPLCLDIASRHDLQPSKVRVTAARSRWGSCSSAGSISLNRNLMFLAPELVESLVLHELAHMRVMNHSARFWRTLAEMDPLAHKHRNLIRAAGELVPAWVDV